jgi:hypothetical protein
MGGQQAIRKSIQEYKPKEAQRYKRFCTVCHRTTFNFVCCGKRTRRLNLQTTLADKVMEVSEK